MSDTRPVADQESRQSQVTAVASDLHSPGMAGMVVAAGKVKVDEVSVGMMACAVASREVSFVGAVQAVPHKPVPETNDRLAQ